jgi:hypothetical protein
MIGMVGYDGVFTDEGIEATSNGDLLGETVRILWGMSG